MHLPGASVVKRKGVEVQVETDHERHIDGGTDIESRTFSRTVKAIISRPRTTDTIQQAAREDRPVSLILHVATGDFAPREGSPDEPAYKGDTSPGAVPLSDGTDDHSQTRITIHGAVHNVVGILPQPDGTTRVEVRRR